MFDSTGPFPAYLLRSAKTRLNLTQLLHNTRPRRCPGSGQITSYTPTTRCPHLIRSGHQGSVWILNARLLARLPALRMQPNYDSFVWWLSSIAGKGPSVKVHRPEMRLRVHQITVPRKASVIDRSAGSSRLPQDHDISR